MRRAGRVVRAAGRDVRAAGRVVRAAGRVVRAAERVVRAGQAVRLSRPAAASQSVRLLWKLANGLLSVGCFARRRYQSARWWYAARLQLSRHSGATKIYEDTGKAVNINK
jgi:hypothetical protein